MLTTVQRTTLADALRADTDPDVVAALAIRNDTELTRLYNLSSTFVVWRTNVPVAEYRDALTWTEVDGLTAGKARIWEWVTGLMTMPLQANKLAVRQGLADCWAANSTTRASLLAVAKRFATKTEKLFTTGTGTTATPGDLVVEGTLTTEDVGRALNDN